MAIITKPLYSGTGYRLYNGASVGLTYQITSDSIEQAILDVVSEIRAVLGGPGSTITQMLGASAQQQQQIAVYSRGAAAMGVLASLVAPEVGVPLALGAEVIAIANELDLTGEVQAPTDMPQNTVNNIVDGTYPVTPVTPPPSGYGGGDPDDIAAAVFAYPVNWQNATGDVNLNFSVWLQEVMATLGPQAWAAGLPDPRNPYFCLVGPFPTNLTYGALIPWSASAIPPVPALDFSAVLPADTVLSYLNREQAGYTWTMQGPWGEAIPAGVYAALAGEYAGRYWRCVLTDEELHLLAGQLGGTAVNVPPIWPGEDNVTYGTPVAVSGVTSISAPMDGILLSLTTVPVRNVFWTAEAYQGLVHVGGVQFLSDAGDIEGVQFINNNVQLFAARTIKQAEGCIIRVGAGISGVATPWTVNP